MRGRSRITFYLEAGETAAAKLGEVRIALSALKAQRSDCGTLLMTLADLEDADWENNWKQYYQPLEIGERLLVVPEWLRDDPEVREKLSGGRVPLLLDPGLTFGTGGHATTRLCLDGAGEDHPGRRAGAGPGLRQRHPLHRGGEAGRRLRRGGGHRRQVPPGGPGERRPQRHRGGRVHVRIGDILRDEDLRAAIGGGYQVVLANIVADVIIGLAPAVRGLLAEGGVFLCSGIIDDRAEEVAERPAGERPGDPGDPQRRRLVRLSLPLRPRKGADA